MSRKAGINYKFESGVRCGRPEELRSDLLRHMWQTYHNQYLYPGSRQNAGMQKILRTKSGEKFKYRNQCGRDATTPKIR